MPSFIKTWIHLIWATKNRESLITRDLKLKLFNHIRENAKAKNIHIDFIGGIEDHIHLLVSLRGDQAISKVAQLIKGESSHWVNQNGLTKTHFEWQNEFIALSVSESVVPKVREYIRNQEQHHRKKSYEEEYRLMKKKHGFVENGDDS